MKYFPSLIAALVLASPVAVYAAELTVVSAGSVQAPMEQLAASYAAKTGNKVNVSVAAGGVLRQRAKAGEQFDVIVMQPPFDEVLASGHIDTSTATPIATIALGLAGIKGGPKPDMSTPEAVKRMLLASKGVAYADEAGGTTAALFLKALETLGISEQMAPKLKRGHDGLGTMAFITNGEADFGVSFMSGLNRPGVEPVGAFPRALVPVTAYVGFVSAHAKDKTGAKAFLEYIASPEAAQAWTSRGFAPGK